MTSEFQRQFSSSSFVPEIVLLLQDALAFELEFLQGVVQSAFRKTLPINEPDSTEFITGKFPIYFVQIKGRLLQIKAFPTPYFDPEVRPYVNGDPEALRRQL